MNYKKLPLWKLKVRDIFYGYGYGKLEKFSVTAVENYFGIVTATADNSGTKHKFKSSLSVQVSERTYRVRR